jgi:hypothetical protein
VQAGTGVVHQPVDPLVPPEGGGHQVARTCTRSVTSVGTARVPLSSSLSAATRPAHRAASTGWARRHAAGARWTRRYRKTHR